MAFLAIPDLRVVSRSAILISILSALGSLVAGLFCAAKYQSHTSEDEAFRSPTSNYAVRRLHPLPHHALAIDPPGPGKLQEKFVGPPISTKNVLRHRPQPTRRPSPVVHDLLHCRHCRVQLWRESNCLSCISGRCIPLGRHSHHERLCGARRRVCMELVRSVGSPASPACCTAAIKGVSSQICASHLTVSFGQA